MKRRLTKAERVLAKLGRRIDRVVFGKDYRQHPAQDRRKHQLDFFLGGKKDQ